MWKEIPVLKAPSEVNNGQQMVQPEGQTYPSCGWVVPKKRVISNKQRTTNDAISGLPNITSLAAGGGNGALSLDALVGFPLAADLLTICRPIYRDPTNQRWKLNVLQLYRPVRTCADQLTLRSPQ